MSDKDVLYDKIKRLLNASKSGDFNVNFDASSLYSEEAEIVRLLNESVNNFRIAAEYDTIKYKLANNALGIALWDMDVVSEDPVNPENKFTWSQEFRNMLGYSDENDFPNLLHSWGSLLHPDDKEDMLNAFSAHIGDQTGKTPFNIECRLKHKNGHYRYYHVFGTSLRDSTGKALRVAGAIADVHEKKKMLETIKRRAIMIDALNTALEIFISCNNVTFEKVMTHGIRLIADAVKLDRVSVYRYKNTDEGKRPGMTFLWDKAQGGTSPVYEKLAILPQTKLMAVWMNVLSQGYHINGRITDMSEEEAAFLGKFGVKTIFIAPIFTHGELWGAIALEDNTSDEFFEEGSVEVEILELSARILAKTLMRAETERDLAEAEKFTHEITEASPIAYILFDENFIPVDCNESALRMFSCPVKKILLNEYWERFIPIRQPDGTDSAEIARIYFTKVLTEGHYSHEWLNKTFNGEPLPIENTLTRLTHNDKTFVVSFKYDLRNIKKMENDINILKTEAEKIYYDGLTGIYNRRYFDENLNRLLKSLSRSNGMLSLMMIDIDRFKQYNDTYGHDKGDECLKIIAATLTKSITRDTDFVARYGGEEFSVVLPNTDEKGACMIAKKLLEKIQNCKIPHANNDAADCVTVSIGLTTGKVDFLQTSGDYIKKADEMLYISKQSGRNRSTFSHL